MPPEHRILCVDDEPAVVASLQRTLAFNFNIHTAGSGAEALKRLEAEGEYAVVVSDMRTPEMNGAELHSRVKQIQPQAARMLLTGQADVVSTSRGIREALRIRENAR